MCVGGWVGVQGGEVGGCGFVGKQLLQTLELLMNRSRADSHVHPSQRFLFFWINDVYPRATNDINPGAMNDIHP